MKLPLMSSASLLHCEHPLRPFPSQGVLTVWEESPEMKTASRGQQRQVFLFKDCVILCKLKRGPGANADVYGFKNKMKVRKV